MKILPSIFITNTDYIQWFVPAPSYTSFMKIKINLFFSNVRCHNVYAQNTRTTAFTLNPDRCAYKNLQSIPITLLCYCLYCSITVELASICLVPKMTYELCVVLPFDSLALPSRAGMSHWAYTEQLLSVWIPELKCSQLSYISKDIESQLCKSQRSLRLIFVWLTVVLMSIPYGKTLSYFCFRCLWWGIVRIMQHWKQRV